MKKIKSYILPVVTLLIFGFVLFLTIGTNWHSASTTHFLQSHDYFDGIRHSTFYIFIGFLMKYNGVKFLIALGMFILSLISIRSKNPIVYKKLNRFFLSALIIGLVYLFVSSFLCGGSPPIAGPDNELPICRIL